MACQVDSPGKIYEVWRIYMGHFAEDPKDAYQALALTTLGDKKSPVFLYRLRFDPVNGMTRQVQELPDLEKTLSFKAKHFMHKLPESLLPKFEAVFSETQIFTDSRDPSQEIDNAPPEVYRRWVANILKDLVPCLPLTS